MNKKFLKKLIGFSLPIIVVGAILGILYFTNSSNAEMVGEDTFEIIENPQTGEIELVLGAASVQDSYTPTTDGCGAIRDVHEHSQSWTASGDYDLSSVKLRLNKYNTPAGDLLVEIQAADGSNKPTGAVLGDGTIGQADVTSGADCATYALEEITIDEEPSITSGNEYVIRLSCSGCAASAGYRIIYETSGSYAGGEYCDSGDSGSSWSCGYGIDWWFEIYGDSGGGGETTDNPIFFGAE